jgi:hypothetical protein
MTFPDVELAKETSRLTWSDAEQLTKKSAYRVYFVKREQAKQLIWFCDRCVATAVLDKDVLKHKRRQPRCSNKLIFVIRGEEIIP